MSSSAPNIPSVAMPIAAASRGRPRGANGGADRAAARSAGRGLCRLLCAGAAGHALSAAAGDAAPGDEGPQTAVVVGPAGEEIYTDKYSRVKSSSTGTGRGKKDANTTCFIRVSSTWAGTGWGFIQIPASGKR